MLGCREAIFAEQFSEAALLNFENMLIGIKS
jgi:hypothetical protein